MVSITSGNFLFETFLIISIACTMWASATIIRLDLKTNSRHKPLAKLSSFISGRLLLKTSGLFVRLPQIRRLHRDRVLDDVYVIRTSQNMFLFNGTCGVPVEVENGVGMPECDVDPWAPLPLNGTNWYGTTRGCCNTKMRVELPQTVTSVITQKTHNVLQFPYSSQLVHAGYCHNEGGLCVLGGRCATVYRIQWLLVRAAPISTSSADGGGPNGPQNVDGDVQNGDVNSPQNSNGYTIGKADIFVPTMVPNHCQCVFS